MRLVDHVRRAAHLEVSSSRRLEGGFAGGDYKRLLTACRMKIQISISNAREREREREKESILQTPAAALGRGASQRAYSMPALPPAPRTRRHLGADVPTTACKSSSSDRCNLHSMKNYRIWIPTAIYRQL
ncbi:hypothetical protein HBI13_013990 [Parastagonospora nodorum]|nr:hypothetical protein HBI10_084160 [Parastagonospora nodorum]KAH4031672.1 hypothetical protein HBI13_013990 [Parastagonospora nodorum]KAH5325723.1 hypothetical protein HBI11_032580 [Parastagonospora nodorum]KAH6085290.1 hypothetical protein HBI65_193520 [Parastagonospora nodorum]KAH6134565.1 hypothetical protein HBI64_060160 [Parastagonospora nodorum]